MKSLVLVLISVVGIGGSVAKATEPSRFYDAHGAYQGMARSEGDHQNSFYDKHGSYTGKSVRRGKEVDFYDAHGRYTGSERR